MDTDYLVIGSGASAMAFVDVMLRESDATFAMVDRRHVPGGHWNDAYPFVRLHQPSAFYGVASRELGRNRVVQSGLNRGFYELASGVEITHYYHALMEDVFLPSGRVRYFPLCEWSGNGEVVSLLSGERYQVHADEKLVNATHLTTSVPLTHERKFEVADGLVCEPPNHLPRLAREHRRIMVLGGGKTAIDAVTWLLGSGYPSEALSWVVPRDAWLLNRAHVQPGYENFDLSVGGLATQWEICATASNVEELCRRMERAGIWLRLDPAVWPRMFHAATVSERELEELRRVRNVIRCGRVTRIEPDAVVLEHGLVDSTPDTLYVDCTASAVAANVNDRTAVFRPGEISLQMIRPFQPCFSAAVIGHIEATIDDDERKRSLTLPTPMTDTIEDWLTVQADAMINGAQWSLDPELDRWLARCRLNGFADAVAKVAPDDVEKRAVLERIARYAPEAIQNLQRLASEVRREQ